jgi:hypothetical protein
MEKHDALSFFLASLELASVLTSPSSSTRLILSRLSVINCRARFSTKSPRPPRQDSRAAGLKSIRARHLQTAEKVGERIAVSKEERASRYRDLLFFIDLSPSSPLFVEYVECSAVLLRIPIRACSNEFEAFLAGRLSTQDESIEECRRKSRYCESQFGSRSMSTPSPSFERSALVLSSLQASLD